MLSSLLKGLQFLVYRLALFSRSTLTVLYTLTISIDRKTILLEECIWLGTFMTIERILRRLQDALVRAKRQMESKKSLGGIS